MGKKIYLYGNWKMNMNAAETKKFFDEFAGVYKAADDLEIGVFSPFTSLWALAEGAKKNKVVFGAQNVYFEEKGAFTGEVSIPMLKEIGVTHVILGHSERRHIFGEPDEMIAKKVKAVLDAGMIPVLCYGETLEEREGGNTFKVMERQLKSAIETRRNRENHLRLRTSLGNRNRQISNKRTGSGSLRVEQKINRQ